uniref:Putative dna replication licensing factor mcm6 component n=1 Tax=Ixodes ricinus TaxID=34613 RepID=A0A0K8RCM9_IXORI
MMGTDKFIFCSMTLICHSVHRLDLLLPNGCPGVQSSLHSRFSDGDGLLFHSFMNSNLIAYVHLIKLINTTHTIISQHQSSSFNDKLMRFFISPVTPLTLNNQLEHST